MPKALPPTRYIFVIGGVMSSVGKGVTTASIGRILQSKGYKVALVKCDMYVNIDAGTMRPTEHGEVFVGSDGIEADQDLGNYERFTGNLSIAENYITTGQIYLEVIRRERNLEYGGEDVEVVPDIPNEIIRRINLVVKKGNPDFVIVEIGGTVGEYQNILFLEAGRMLRLKNPGMVQFVLVSYLPVPAMVGEMKTKPTQYAVRTLNSAGIQPDFIVGRSEQQIDQKRKNKMSILCNVSADDIISAPDAASIYEVPLNLEKDEFGDKILAKFGLARRKKDLRDWRAMVRKIRNSKKPLDIAVVGKYFATGDYTLVDSYISVVEALRHACWQNNRMPRLHWINSEDFEKNPKNLPGVLKNMDGILVPGGFGGRGVEGIIMAIKAAREKKIPYFGLCFGMQLATIEFARNVCGMKNANSTEIDRDTKYPVIDVMPEQKKNLADKNFGATMRLGDYPCKLKKDTLAYSAYKTSSVVERHRHRYEVNNKYRKALQSKGMVFSGIYTKKDLVEIAELDRKLHPWFLGTQFHPEFQSRPWKPQPLFDGFIKAAIKKSK